MAKDFVLIVGKGNYFYNLNRETRKITLCDEENVILNIEFNALKQKIYH